MFQNFKAIFLDSEGTIRDSNHVISKDTIESIDELEKIGINVIITSGLPRFLVKNISTKAHASKYIIASNGADLYNRKSMENVYSYYLNQDFIYRLWSEYKDKFIFILGTGDEEYASSISEYNKNPIILNDYNIKNNFYQCHISQKPITIKDNIKEELIVLKEMLKQQKNKELIKENLYNQFIINGIDYLDNLEINTLLKLKRFLELRKIKEEIINNYSDIVSIANQSIDFSSSSISLDGETPWFSINNKLVTKGNGIKKMCEYLNIDKNHVIGIGNDYNDRTMQNSVGMFLCPSDSCQIILDKSDFVYNKEEGISKILRKVRDENV